MFKVQTTYREFNDAYLNALENDELSSFRDDLKDLLNGYPYHYNAGLFLARAQVGLNEAPEARATYTKCLNLIKEDRIQRRNLSQLLSEIRNFATLNKFHDLINLCAVKEEQYKERKMDGVGIIVPKMVKKSDEFSHGSTLLDEASTLLKEGKILFNKKDFRGSIDTYIKYEEKFGYPGYEFSLWVINSARALRNHNVIIKYAKKGFEDTSSIKGYEDLLAMSLPSFRIREKWDLIDEFIHDYLEISNNPKKYILKANIEAKLNLKDSKGSLSALNTYESLYPHDESISRLKSKVDAIVEEEPKAQAMEFEFKLTKAKAKEEELLAKIQEILDEDYDFSKSLSTELDFELKQKVDYEISPMLRADYTEYKFINPIIIQQAGKVNKKDANKLLRGAEFQLSNAIKKHRPYFPHYTGYLEAAKAYSVLPSKSSEDLLFQRALGRYASLRGSDFFESFKKAINKNIDISKVIQLKDSASSYYYEALRLKLDTKDSGTKYPGFVLAGEVVLKYLKLNSIFYKYKNEILIDKQDWKGGFLVTSDRLIKQGGEEILAQTFLNIGAANPQNFSMIMARESKLLKGEPRIVFEDEGIRNRIFSLMGNLVGIEYDKKENIDTNLQLFFNEVAETRYIKLDDEFEIILQMEFDSSEIQELYKKLDFLSKHPDKILLTVSDIQLLKEMTDISNIYEPYLKSDQVERSVIITTVRDKLKTLRKSISKNPTYWSGVKMKPIISNWLNNITKQERKKALYIKPKIEINIDPECILLTEDGGQITVGIRNIGVAIANNLSCDITLSFDDKVIHVVEKFQQKELKPGMRDTIVFFTDKESLELLKGKKFNCMVIVEGDYLNKIISAKENFTLAIEKSLTFELEDIPWSETRKVPEYMFKGRTGLIKQLTRHYLSANRGETYILYGLTRHGKTSIHHYLSKNLKNKNIQDKDLKFLPFQWDFGEASTCSNSKEFWEYIIRICLIETLEQYVDQNIVPNEILDQENYKDILIKGEKRGFRANHLGKFLDLLNQNGFIAFISIDEFTFYTELIDKKIIQPSFLALLRKLTIDNESACFIYSGVYDLIDIIRGEKYGITSQLANTREYQVGGIDPASSEELIQIMGEKLVFTKPAVGYIQNITNNIPFFIQMVCRRCGRYAFSKKKSIIGIPEIEKIVKYMTGELIDSEVNDVYKIYRLDPGVFNNTQYRLGELYENALISTIALRSTEKDGNIRSDARDFAEEEIVQTWGTHRQSEEHPGGMLGDRFQGELRDAIEKLKKRGIIEQTKGEAEPFYKLSVDLFRRWWSVEYPNLSSELDKLIREDNN